MVQINLPPPLHPPDPVFSQLNQGSTVLRIFDPTHHNTQPLTFRYYGALHRFDHQRYSVSSPADDPDRSIYYAAFSLPGCLI